MNCHDARESFSAWVDDTLTADERASLAAHLADCGECRRELARFRDTVALLSRVERPRAPAGLAERVLGAVRPVGRRRRLVTRLFFPLSVKLPAEAAALLLVAGLAVYVFQRTPALQHAARQEASRPTISPILPPPTAPLAEPAPQAPPPATAAPPTAAPPATTRAISTPPMAAPPARAPATTTPSGKTLAAPESPVAPPSKPAPDIAVSPVPPPAEAVPTGSVPGPPAELRQKTEARRRADATSNASGGATAPPAESAKSAATPALPPPATASPSTTGEVAKDRVQGAAMTRESAQEPASRRAPAVERPRDSAAAHAQSVPAQPPSAPRAAMSATAAPDVIGRLTVRDRRAAENALVELLARTRGTLVARRDEGDGTVIDLVVPRAGYAEFNQGLARIGTWLTEREAVSLPPDVRVALRLAE